MYVRGLEQPAKFPVSIRQSKDAPDATLVNANVAVRSSVVELGPELITGAGGRVTTQMYVRSGLVPVELRARTRNVCCAADSDVYVLGLEHVDHVGDESSRHWNDVAPALENRKVADVWYDGFDGADVMVGTGGAAARTAAAGVAAAAGESVTAVLAYVAGRALRERGALRSLRLRFVGAC